uniref:Peptidase S72 domain-containing protein n=1 Tax=Caenorhabditis tropicalis TaxID=1561998 RepID=A0A1I7TCS5_9PELO
MRVLLFLLLFVHLTDTVSYHPLQDYKLHINGSAEYRNFSINASTLFSEIVLHPKIFLCIENQLDSNVSIHLWNYVHESFKNTLDLDHKLTAVGKTLITDWNRVIENGLKISVDTHGTNATGYLIFKKCRRDLFTTLGMDNIRVELKQMFNCTGFIQLYISRCEFSPKLKLFAPMKIGSATFDKETVNYISALFNDTSCLNDYQGKRYEYRTKDKYGLYFHIEALEDSIGYTAIYESFRAKLIYHEIENEEYVEGERDTSVVNIFRIMKPLEVTTEMVISYLLDRTRLKPPVSLRLYVSATAPIELSFSQCRSETKRDWKKIGSNINESVIAWYTFDSEGVDLLRGLTDSPNCQDKPYPRIFLHVKSEKRNNLNFEFSIVNGTDLNVVHSCETSEQLKLEATKLQNQALLVLMHFTLIVIIILGVGSIVLIVKQMRKSGYKKKEKTNQIELTTVPPTELFVPVPNLIDY